MMTTQPDVDGIDIEELDYEPMWVQINLRDGQEFRADVESHTYQQVGDDGFDDQVAATFRTTPMVINRGDTITLHSMEGTELSRHVWRWPPLVFTSLDVITITFNMNVRGNRIG